PGSLPLGQRQRLQLAVALVHEPELLILDEPTSGVDPVARDQFWESLVELSRRDRVTIFVSTHFMNEAERCDRISFMHAGRVLVSDTPAALKERRGVATLEDAFIAYLEDAQTPEERSASARPAPTTPRAAPARPSRRRAFDLRRMASYAWRESLELLRDPIRLVFAGLGSVILLFVMSYGLSWDVEDLTFAVLDRDQTGLSRSYALDLDGS